jgi:phage tail sheath protein FI
MSTINESAIKTPGVYVTEIDAFPPSISQVATAIPAFIGYTDIAQDKIADDLRNKPTRITSMLEYERYFGKAQLETDIKVTIIQTTQNGKLATESITASFDNPANKSRHLMHQAVRFYFDNGGGPCYVISIGGFKTPVGTNLVLTDFYNSGTGVGLEAVEKADEVTLIVFPEGQNLAEADYYTLQNQALALCAKDVNQDKFCIMDIHDPGENVATDSDLTTLTTAFRTGISPTIFEDLNYGAAYFPNLRTVYPYNYTNGTTSNEVNILLEQKIDGANAGFNGQKLNAVNNATTGDIGLYNRIINVLNTQFPMVLPPSSARAGIYAAVDSTRGVWKSPANVGVQSIIGPVSKITDEMQADMNENPLTGKSINAIRAFIGKGTLVWGARTLLGNDNNWRYISVRRFYIMVEKSVKLAAFRFVFEPNDSNTWVRVRAMIENYLTNLWRLGALAGAKPEQAFYVRVGLGVTMTFDDVLNGKLIIEIGMAPVRPAEYIILRFTQIQQTS